MTIVRYSDRDFRKARRDPIKAIDKNGQNKNKLEIKRRANQPCNNGSFSF